MKSKGILIAYQDDFWIRSLSTFLHGLSYKIETARTVSEMIRKVRKSQSSVILLDEEMEGVKAFDLAPLLKKINEKSQVIVISSDASLGQAKRLREAGIFYHAIKPVDLEEIRSAVECAFEKIDRESTKEIFVPFQLQGGFAHEVETL